MIKLIVATSGIALILPSCSNHVREASELSPQKFAKHRSNQSWWRQLNDNSINQDVSAALANSPSLKVIELRSKQAEAAVAAARATTLPRINLGFGYQEGRRREVNSEPYDLAPWQSQSGISWEIDLTGKLKAAKNAAVENHNASIWDIASARQLLASRIANVRMNLYRLNAEITTLGLLQRNQGGTIENLSAQSQAGLIPDSTLFAQRAEGENLKRRKQDLMMLRDITVVQLRSLRGGTTPKNISSAQFPSPRYLPSQQLDKLISSHPSILAAEARVRAAFQLQHSAKLDLLPSFQINLLAQGGQRSLADRFRTWTVKAGPSLNIPIYDPARIANLDSKKAKAKIQAQKYKEVVLKVLEEIDIARIKLISRRAQFTTLDREIAALSKSKKNALDQLNAGVISKNEYLIVERNWLNATLKRSALHQSVLSAHIELIRATGGGPIAR